MLGNSHVQFSGGWARATASGYPSRNQSEIPIAKRLFCNSCARAGVSVPCKNERISEGSVSNKSAKALTLWPCRPA